jgi:phage terminase large subunit
MFDFHKSECPHRLLIGGVGSGKSYAGYHELIFKAIQIPNHISVIWRNTWDTVVNISEKEFVTLVEGYGLIKGGRDKGFSVGEHEVVLVNGHRILFRPLTLSIDQIKGMNFCYFLVDDADVRKYTEVLGYLFTRLRNTANAVSDKFGSIWLANYEGKDWLVEQFCYDGGRKKAEGEWTEERPFCHWMPPTDCNKKHLPKDYITLLASTHTEDWMNRHVYMKDIVEYSNLVYADYSEKNTKDLSFCLQRDPRLIKILVVDVGMTVSCVLHMATDGKAVFTYKEFYKRNCKIWELGQYLQSQCMTDSYYKVLIDPASARGEQTSGTSMKKKLQEDYGVFTTPANNAWAFGVGLVRDMIAPAAGDPYSFIDISCKSTLYEVKHYKLKTAGRDSETDVLELKEEAIKKRDHAMDCWRYGTVFLAPFVKDRADKLDLLQQRREKMLADRVNNLPFYREHPGLARDAMRREGIREEALRRKIDPRRKFGG